MRKNRKTFWVVLAGLIVLGGILLALPPVWSRVSFRVRQLYAEIFYKLKPPEQVVFNPVQTTPEAGSTTPQPETAQPSATPTVTQVPTPTLIPLPPSVNLQGVRPEAQKQNNCGPATLSMNLSFWGWKGDQDDTAAVMKPYARDMNVMPYEIVDYVNQYTELRALTRMGGDLYTLKALVSAGFPVLLEKGYDPLDHNDRELGWMGHYNLVIGYDDAQEAFNTQDSYLLAFYPYEKREFVTGFSVPYAEMEKNWRAFNYVFIVVYRPEYENDVLNLLGPLADESTSYRMAYDRAVSETATLGDARDQFFAMFNQGTSLVKLQDYAAAASAYDQAYAFYPSINEKTRPWRMLWYQTGPYFAYFYSARYQDVINLATTTLEAMPSPILEESYHWRALAKLALGEQDGAIVDLREALRYHPDFAPSLQQLSALGMTP